MAASDISRRGIGKCLLAGSVESTSDGVTAKAETGEQIVNSPTVRKREAGERSDNRWTVLNYESEPCLNKFFHFASVLIAYMRYTFGEGWMGPIVLSSCCTCFVIVVWNFSKFSCVCDSLACLRLLVVGIMLSAVRVIGEYPMSLLRLSIDDSGLLRKF